MKTARECRGCGAALDDYADWRRRLCSDCLFDDDGDLVEDDEADTTPGLR